VTTSHTVNVLLDGTLLTLNRAVGVLRRRNVAVERLTVHPRTDDGASRLTFALTADAATVDRVIQQFRKIVGVRAVEAIPNDLNNGPTNGGADMSSSQVRVFYDADADQARLKGRIIAVIGYGSQGHAHALNLRESGAQVIVGLRESGTSWLRAKDEGLDVRSVADAARAADIIMMLVPDQEGRTARRSCSRTDSTCTSRKSCPRPTWTSR